MSETDSAYRPYTPENEGPPEFLAKLGLAVPVSLEDIEQAFRDKVLTAHPDKGGDPDEVCALQTAYEQAKEYTKFRSRTRRRRRAVPGRQCKTACRRSVAGSVTLQYQQ